MIRRLKAVADAEAKARDEEKALREKAARKQADVTGQSDEVDADRRKDREIAMQRQRHVVLKLLKRFHKSNDEQVSTLGLNSLIAHLH